PVTLLHTHPKVLTEASSAHHPMSEDKLEGRGRRMVAAHLSLGRRRVVRHNELQKATADFDAEGHRRNVRGKRMNNKPFDAGLRDLVAEGVYRRTSKGYYLVPDQERIAEFFEGVKLAVESPVRIVGRAIELFRLVPPRGEESWSEYAERVRRTERFFRRGSGRESVR